MKKSEVLKTFLNYAIIALFGILSYTFLNHRKLEFYEFVVLGAGVIVSAGLIFYIVKKRTIDD